MCLTTIVFTSEVYRDNIRTIFPMHIDNEYKIWTQLDIFHPLIN